MEYLPINNLPNELLELIFDHLEVDDLKNASLVCKRWSRLAFSGRRMDRVFLVPKFPCENGLLQSHRKHRHLELREIEKCTAHVKELFQAFNFSSLRIMDYFLTRSELRLILLEVPNLQYLSIWYEPRQLNEMSEPFPVMRKLEWLEIQCSPPESRRTLHWHTIAPSLQGLKMPCYFEDQLEQWRLFSGQLKQLHATFLEENQFCEMTFPLLEELSIDIFNSDRLESRNSFFTRHEFFRRNGSLRRLHLGGIDLSKTLVKDITNHSKKVTSLEISGRGDSRYDSEPGSLESLAQLTELKHLRLELLDVCIFRGCEALTSLQSLCIDNGTTFGRKGSLGFFEDLLKIAPQVRYFKVSVVMSARPVQYICNKFTKLTHLQMKYSEKVTHGGLSEIHRLPLLWYLELKLIAQNISFISTIPQNKVRWLTLHLPDEYDGNDLLQLPEVFPQLDRLNLINSCRSLREATVDRLHQLLPTCVIKIYGQLITSAGVRKCFSKWPEKGIVPVWGKRCLGKYRDI